MRLNPFAIVLLLVLFALLPLVLAARSSLSADAPVLLATAVLEVKDEAVPFPELFRAPETATWVTIRNDSAQTLLLGMDRGLNLGNAWALTTGEELTFSLESPVHLRAVTGSLRMRVLAGR